MRIRCLLLCFLLPMLMVAQRETDSLAVERLIAQSRTESKTQKAVELAFEATALAQNHGYYLQTEASRALISAHFGVGDDYEALRTLLELNSRLEKAGRWPDVVANFELLGNYYASTNLLASAVEKLRSAEALAAQYNVPFDVWQNRITLGDLLLEQNKYAEALVEYEFALATLNKQKQPDENRLMLTYRQMSIAYSKQANYVDATWASLKVLEGLEKNPDSEAYATQLNNIGFAYHKMGDYPRALSYFLQTLKTRTKLGFEDRTHPDLLTNIGITYQNLQKLPESRVYLQRAANASVDLAQQAHINDLIAMAYLASGESAQAVIYNKRSLAQAHQSKDKRMEAEAWRTSSIINENLLNYMQALADFKQYLKITDSLQAGDAQRQQELLQAEYAVERTQGEIQTLLASNQIKDYQIQQLRLENENRQKELQIQQAEAKAKLQALELERSKLKEEAQAREVAILRASEENQRLLLEQQRLQESRAVQDLKLAEEQNRVQELQLAQRAAQTRNLRIIILLGFVLFVLSIYALWRTNKSRKELAASREIIKQERDKSDVLLLNILPESTANELKVNGKAAPRKFGSATVFFSDFQSFSSLSQNYSPEELIEELELFFGGFDRIISKYGIEKIKTIGDAYMCAAGIPQSMENHAHRMVEAAMDMIAFAREVHKEQLRRGHQPWHLRIGINSGPVIAGVIGSKKFIYDVWGETVNLAARLETAGEPNQINISNGTMQLIEADFETEYRGKIEVKNMGEVDMYFVRGKK